MQALRLLTQRHDDRLTPPRLPPASLKKQYGFVLASNNVAFCHFYLSLLLSLWILRASQRLLFFPFSSFIFEESLLVLIWTNKILTPIVTHAFLTRYSGEKSFYANFFLFWNYERKSCFCFQKDANDMLNVEYPEELTTFLSVLEQVFRQNFSICQKLITATNERFHSIFGHKLNFKLTIVFLESQRLELPIRRFQYVLCGDNEFQTFLKIFNMKKH